jgi:AbrB family looped-hinge helix DNA binding protein
MTTAKLTTKGQVTIPGEVRRHLGVGQGDRIDFRIEPGGLVTVRRLGARVRDLFGVLERPGQHPLALPEIDAEISEQMAAEDERILRGDAHPPTAAEGD